MDDGMTCLQEQRWMYPCTIQCICTSKGMVSELGTGMCPSKISVLNVGCHLALTLSLSLCSSDFPYSVVNFAHATCRLITGIPSGPFEPSFLIRSRVLSLGYASASIEPKCTDIGWVGHQRIEASYLSKYVCYFGEEYCT